MTATITKLPSAATSFYEIAKIKGGWKVDLVTPPPRAGLKGLRTTLAKSSDREAIVDYGKQAAERTFRPLEIRRGA